LIGLIFRNRHIQSHVRKRSLETDPCGHINIKDKLLKGLLNLFVTQIVVSDKWGQKGIKI